MSTPLGRPVPATAGEHPTAPGRPPGVTAVGVVAMVLGSMMLVGAVLLVGAGTLQGPWGNFQEFGEISFWLPPEGVVAGIFLGLVGGAHVVVGGALLRGRTWARAGALTLIGLQIASGVVDAARGELDQLTQAAAYAVAAWALLTPRARAWFASRRPSPMR